MLSGNLTYLCNNKNDLIMTGFEKKRISLRYWLLGMANVNSEYNKCLKAMEFAALHHKGVRKDLVTPEFDHQLTLAHFIRTIHINLLYPVETFCTIFLHDVVEDYDISIQEIELAFGNRVARSTELMTKVYRGVKKTNEVYFNGISTDPIASICKGADRIHNLQSMPKVFTVTKQSKYILEAQEWILPALKTARRNYPEQELAYENIKLMMNSQIYLLKHAIECQK